MVTTEKRDRALAVASLINNEESDIQFEKLGDEPNTRLRCEETNWLKCLPNKVEITEAVRGEFINEKLKRLGAENEAKRLCCDKIADKESVDILTILAGAHPELNFERMLELATHTDANEELPPIETMSEPKACPMLRPNTVIVNEDEAGMNGFGILSAEGAEKSVKLKPICPRPLEKFPAFLTHSGDVHIQAMEAVT